MTREEAAKVLDEEGVDGLIDKSYPKGHPFRICLMRIHHAGENVGYANGHVADSLSQFLCAPTEYVADELVVEAVRDLIEKLKVLQGELEKSLPVLSDRKAKDYVQEGRDPGLRGGPPKETREGRGDPPGFDPSDWDDVPF